MLVVPPGWISELERTGTFGPQEYLRAVERAYLYWGRGRGSLLRRQNLWVSARQGKIDGSYFMRPGSAGSLKLLAAALPDAGIVGAVIYAAGFHLSGADVSVLLYHAQDGDLRAHVHGDTVFTARKTGAVAAVATKHLADPALAGGFSLGLVGAGNIALHAGEAIAMALPVRHIAVSGRAPERVAACARRLAALAPAHAVSVRDAVERSDVVVLATTSRIPVINGAWLKQGALVLAMGAHYPEAREVDDATVARARIVVDSREQALAEKGDLLVPLSTGVIRPSDVSEELGTVVASRRPHAANGKDLTLFCSGGAAFEYLAVADAIVAKIDGERRDRLDPRVEER